MSDLSTALADEFTEAIFKNTAPTILPVANVYVTLYDGTGTEIDGDLQNGRVQTAPADWTLTTSNDVENATEVNFGEALSDISQISEVALFDAATGGSEIARYALEESFDVSTATRVFFPVATLTFDVLDRTE